LLATQHLEVILETIEVGQEDNARLVEPRRCLEDVPRKRHGRRQDLVETGEIVCAKLLQGSAGRRRDGIKNAEQGV